MASSARPHLTIGPTTSSQTSLYLRRTLAESNAIPELSPPPPGCHLIMATHWNRFSADGIPKHEDDPDMKASKLLANTGVMPSYDAPLLERFALAPQDGIRNDIRKGVSRGVATRVAGRNFTPNASRPDAVKRKFVGHSGMTYIRIRAYRAAEQQKRLAYRAQMLRHGAKCLIQKRQQDDQHRPAEPPQDTTNNPWRTEEHSRVPLPSSLYSSSSGSSESSLELEVASDAPQDNGKTVSARLIFDKKKVLDKVSTSSLLTASLSQLKSKTPSFTDGSSTSASSSASSFLEMKKRADKIIRFVEENANARTAVKPKVTVEMAREHGIEVLSASNLGDTFEDSDEE